MKKIAFITISIIALFFTVSFTNKTFAFSQKTSLNLDDYYNSDNLLINEHYQITDYNELIGKNVSYSSDNDPQNPGGLPAYVINESSTSDYIVEIIPYTYFYEEIEALEIGNEYGFYIKTTKEENYYTSKVLVFDIEKDLNLIENNDRINYSITVLFNYNYIALLPDEKNLNYNEHFIDNEYNLEIVIPVCTAFTKPGVTPPFDYEFSNDLYLKDISFAASLYNEQALNYGDNNYNAYNDYGSYFTGIDYEYNGKYWDEHELNVEDTIWTFGNTVSFFVGIIKKIPGPIKVIADLFETASLVNDIIETIQDGYNTSTGEIKESTRKVTGIFYHNNRDDQLANNIDSDGNHFLIKSVGLSINTEANKSLWYNVNDYAKVYYNIGHSAINDIKSEPTRINSELAFKVVDKSSNTVVATGAKTITDLIRTNEPDELTISNQCDLYFLPNGINTYTFTAPYAGEYIFNINSSNNITTYIDNTLYTNDSSYNLNQGETIIIKAIGDDTAGQGTISVDVSNDINNIQIGSNEEYIVKLLNYNGVYQINTNDSNVVVSNILILENSQFVEYGNYNEYPFNLSSMDYPIFTNEIYVILKNKTNNSCSINLNVSDVVEISTDSITNKVINSYPNYVKFIPSETDNYIISYDNINGDRFNFSILDSSGSNLSFNLKSLYVYDVALKANQVYYINYYTNTTSSDASIAIKKSDKSFAWEIIDLETNKSISTNVNNPFKVNLQVGKEYELTFTINDHIDIQNFITNDSIYSYMLTTTGIEILDSSKVGDPGIQIRAKYNEETSYDYPLTIIPEIDYSKISFSLSNSSHITARIEVPRYVKAANISINGNEETKYFSNYKKGTNIISFDLTDDTYDYLFSSHRQINVKLINVVIEDAKGDEFTYIINQTLSTDNYFAGGSGSLSNPYTISTYRHFYNIRNVANSYGYVNYSFKLLNDITITNNDDDWSYDDPTWEMADLTLIGNFDGNYNTIHFVKVYIDTDPFASNALFSQNWGTIKNLNIQVGSISCAYLTQNADLIYIGILTGTNEGTISNCNFTCINSDGNYGTMIRYDNCYVGSFAGFNTGTITNCEATVNFSFWGNKGGICGYNSSNGVISNCITNGKIAFESPDPNVNKQYATGGIAALNYGTVKNCKNYASISYDGDSSESRILQPIIGQIIGINYGTQSNNYCYGSVNKGNLKTITWTTGALWWQETHSFNQAQYVSNGAVGQEK